VLLTKTRYNIGEVDLPRKTDLFRKESKIMVYVLSKDGKPLMPTKRYGKVRRMLNDGKAKVIKARPFTIQLTYETTHYTQPITLGIDAGYSIAGFSAVSGSKELIAGECKFLESEVDRNKERRIYRRDRRNQKRYRAPRFNNRRKPKDWLAPSIQHKLDIHIRIVSLIKSILPITKTIIEIAAFDIQKIKNPDIKGKEYQEGEQTGFWNLREYILHRDSHECQNQNCLNKEREIRMQVHHVGFWENDETNRPGNLITLCDKCHRPENHQKEGLLWGWKPNINPFKAETFMTTVRWRLVNQLDCEYTYGYITKSRRIALHLEKSHANDAFCVAGGAKQARCNQLKMQQVRRNNRCLRLFYDAIYVDRRNGEHVSGQTLNSGRRTRNKNLNGPNLRIYRSKKVSKGRYQYRTTRYSYQPGDMVLFQGKKYTVRGSQNYGEYIRLKELSKPVRVDLLRSLYYGKGLQVV